MEKVIVDFGRLKVKEGLFCVILFFYRNVCTEFEMVINCDFRNVMNIGVIVGKLILCCC